MEDAPLENDSTTWLKGDVSLKVDLEMTQCNAEEKRKRKRKRKRKNQTSNSLKSKDTDDNLPNDTSIKASPIKIDSILHPPVNTCLSTDSEIIQHDAEVILSQKIDNGKKKNSRHNALTSNDTNHNFQDGGRRPSCYLTNTEFVERVDGNSVSEVAEQLSSFQKCLDASSTKKHDDQAQVDTSLDVSSTKPIQTKKRVKRNRRKRRKLSDSTVSGLGSIKEAASPSVLVVQDSSVRDTSLNHSDEAYASSCSEKMMGVGEVVVDHGTSLMVTGDISLDKASGGCPDGEPACGQQEKKVELENLKGINNEQSVVNDASQVEIFCQHGDREDKPNVIQNAVLNDDRAQVDTSLDVSSTKPNQRKKRVKRKRRKRRKLSDSTVNGLGSIKEAASPSVLVVQDSSVRDTSLNHSDEAYASGCSEKMMGVGEVVANHGTSLMVTGDILLDNASRGCPDGERASREQEKKVEMENLKAINNEQSVANDASQLNLPEIFCEHVDREDKPNAIQNAVLDDDQAQVDTSLDVGSTKPIQTKKRVKRNRRKKRNLSDSTITGLGSIKEAACPSVLVVPDSSVRDTSLNHSDEAYASGCSEKMMGVGEVVADHGTFLMVTGDILLDKASGGCPDGERASGEQEKKVEMENLKAINNEQSVANDASQLNLPEIFCEHVDREDKPNAIQNAVLGEDQAQVDTSLDVSSTKPIQTKKRVKRNRRKKRKLSDSTINGLESIKESACPSVLVVQDSSVRDTSLNHSDEAYASGCSEKMMGVGEVVADHGASLMVIGDMFLDKASGGCPDGEPACGQQEKKVELENLKGINNEQCVVNDASQVEIFCELGNREDKPNVIQNAVLDDDLAQVDTSLDMSSTKPNQRKKRVKRNRRKKRKLSDSTVNGLGSIKEAASPSVLVVQDSSVRATSLNHSDEAYASGCSEKMMGVGEVVADHGTSLMVTTDISLDKASGGCPDSKPASWEQEKKVELENLKGINNDQSVVNNVSKVDLPEIFCEHGNREDKPNIIQNAVLDDDQAQVDTSFDLSSTNPNQKKKRVKSNPRKRRKLSDSRVTGLGSIKEAASSSLVVVQDSSVRDTLNHSDEACASGCSEKMMGVGEVVAEHGTSLLVTGDISLDKASRECPDGEPESMEQEKKVEMESLKGINNDHSVVNDASRVDLPDFFFKHGNRDKDKPNVIQNAVLDVSAEEICHKSTTFYKEDKASDDASGSDPSVENLEYDNLDIQPKLKDATPSSSQLGAMTDDDHDVSLAVIGKEGPRQRLQSSVGVPPGNLRKKLLVLDVNGLLADIVLGVSKGYKPDTIVSKKAVFKRPFCDDFLQFCFERFRVGVWSSRTKKNVESVLDFLMGKSKRNLLFCWNQSHCTDTGFYTVEDRDKPLVLKEIKKLWEKRDRSLPWKRGEYNESNTLLLDDSPYKALRNPPHTAIFPHSYQYKDVNDNSLGPGGDLRVYLEGLALADNVQKYVELNPFGQRPITKTNLSWGFYLKVIGTVPSLEEEDA